MGQKLYSRFTAIATALAAIALVALPYEAGAFPGGLFEQASVGPVPLWAACVALSTALAFICLRTAAALRSVRERP